MSTRVISVRGGDRKALLADPKFRYVGRYTRGGWRQSGYGNPFKVGESYPTCDGRTIHVATPELSVKCFTHSLLQAMTNQHMKFDQFEMEFAHIAECLHELKGLTLGCWCTCWTPGQAETATPCHAIPLAILAEMSPVFTPTIEELNPWHA